MLDILDIRTLSFTTMLFSFIYGIGLIVYAVNHPKFDGISKIGIAFLLISVGFLLVGFRQYINDFMSIIVANLLILIALIMLYQGLVLFRQIRIKWAIFLELSLVLSMLPLFYFYTFVEPNVNARIIIIAGCFFLQFLLISFALLYRTKIIGGVANSFLGVMFLIFSLFYLFRIFWTLGEGDLRDFMDAGIVHAISIINFQALVLFTSFSVVWIASNELEKELKEQARIDPLTLVYNRRALEDIANIEISRVIRNNHPLTVIMCDIDHFKIFNDKHGHQTGDKILVDFAAILKNNVREHDFVTRYGGEEFLVLLPETDIHQATIIAEKLRNKICLHRMAIRKNKTLSVTASFGVADYQKGMTDWQQIVRSADQALYEAKNTGRNRVVVKDIDSTEV